MLFLRGQAVLRTRGQALTKCLPPFLGESIAPLPIQSTKHLLHFQTRSQLIMRPVIPSSLFNQHNNNDTSQNNALFRSYTTSSSDSEERGSLVYQGRVNGLLKKVKIFSLSTSVFGLAAQPYLWYTVQDMSLAFAAPLFTAVNFFVFANPLMIHYLAKRYVNELYYNPKTQTFTAVLLSLFARKTSFAFTSQDVVVPEIPGLFAMLIAKGRPLFVDHNDFTSIEVYKHMMGFDKPLDLTYDVTDSSKSKESEVKE